MNVNPSGTKEMLVDGEAGYELSLSDGAVQINRHGRAAQLVPVRRIARLLLRAPRSAELRTLMEVVERGVPVHIQDRMGRLLLLVTMDDLEPTPSVRELTSQIECQDPRFPYQEWLDLQLRHAASRILRRAPAGSIEMFERRLHDYATRGTDPRTFGPALEEVQALLFAWIDGELTRRKLRGVAAALAWRRCMFREDLDRVLSIPMFWCFGPWLRENPRHHPRCRMQFMASLRPQLEDRLSVALAALEYHLRRVSARAVRERREPRTRMKNRTRIIRPDRVLT